MEELELNGKGIGQFVMTDEEMREYEAELEAYWAERAEIDEAVEAELEEIRRREMESDINPDDFTDYRLEG